jgi:hypothetical protein
MLPGGAGYQFPQPFAYNRLIFKGFIGGDPGCLVVSPKFDILGQLHSGRGKK